MTASVLFNGYMLCVLVLSVHGSIKQSAESVNGYGSCAALHCSLM